MLALWNLLGSHGCLQDSKKPTATAEAKARADAVRLALLQGRVQPKYFLPAPQARRRRGSGAQSIRMRQSDRRRLADKAGAQLIDTSELDVNRRGCA